MSRILYDTDGCLVENASIGYMFKPTVFSNEYYYKNNEQDNQPDNGDPVELDAGSKNHKSVLEESKYDGDEPKFVSYDNPDMQ